MLFNLTVYLNRSEEILIRYRGLTATQCGRKQTLFSTVTLVEEWLSKYNGRCLGSCEGN